MHNSIYAGVQGIYLGRACIRGKKPEYEPILKLVYTNIMVMQDDSIMPPLSQTISYMVVVGIKLAIALSMIFVTRLLKKTVGEDNKKTEMYAPPYSSRLCR